jgi:hypothetical protein
MTDINTNPGSPSGPQRPTLLTVLCILTFIASAWGIVSSIRTYINADAVSGIVNTAMDQAKTNMQENVKDNPEAGKMAEKIMNNATAMTDPAKMKKKAMFDLVANLLAFAGAFLMFNLRKNGFWIYLGNVAIVILAPLIVYGTGNLLVGVTTMVGAFFSILFAVLYSLNLKFMS